jgi:hypothetical protein
MLAFDEPLFKSACLRYQDFWEMTDNVLYELCRQFPNHENRAKSNAKVLIIGRSYVTGTERQIKSDGTQSSAMEQLAEYVAAHGSSIDSIIGSLKLIEEPLDENKLKAIVRAHGELLQIIKGKTRKSQSKSLNPRSFVSKYLHFHNSAVPIYDMVANSALCKIAPSNECPELFPLDDDVDMEYARFVFSFWRLYQETPEPRKAGSVKLLDIYLMEQARQSKMLERGLGAARRAVFPAVPWQRCQFHLQQNAQAYVPRLDQRAAVAQAIRTVFDCPDRLSAQARLKDVVAAHAASAPKLAAWMEENFPQGLAIFAFPAAHQRRLRTSNPLERVNMELERRTRVAGLFPNEASLLRLVSALLAEYSDEWETGKTYLNMEAKT